MTDTLNFSANEEYVSTIPRWMMPFADLLSLILTFFVLMFSMSVPPEKLKQNNEFSKPSPNPYAVTKEDTRPIITVARTDLGLSIDYLYDIIKDQSVIYPSLAKAKLRGMDDKLIISVPSKDFDDEYANGMAHILKNLNNRIELYSSSLNEANEKVRKLQQNGFDKDISFVESSTSRGKIDIIIYP